LMMPKQTLGEIAVLSLVVSSEGGHVRQTGEGLDVWSEWPGDGAAAVVSICCYRIVIMGMQSV
jgi:hypothetical protein